MGIRDNEIERLISYAKGLGLVVNYDHSDSKSAADWTLDGTEITIYTKYNKTKISTILSLIHELGHMVHFIHEKDRQPDLKFDAAIGRQNMFYEEVAKRPAPKKQREKVLQVERAGTKWWGVIYKDTNMKFEYWRLTAAIEFDMWMYEVWVETGHFPKKKLYRPKFREVQQRHKDEFKNKENKR